MRLRTISFSFVGGGGCSRKRLWIYIWGQYGFRSVKWSYYSLRCTIRMHFMMANEMLIESKFGEYYQKKGMLAGWKSLLPTEAGYSSNLSSGWVSVLLPFGRHPEHAWHLFIMRECYIGKEPEWPSQYFERFIVGVWSYRRELGSVVLISAFKQWGTSWRDITSRNRYVPCQYDRYQQEVTSLNQLEYCQIH